MTDYWSEDSIRERTHVDPSMLNEVVKGKVRRRRAVPLDPTNPKTWQEVADLQPRLKSRLAAGGWYAFHVRKQGDYGLGQEGSHQFRKRAGIIESVPPQASTGVLDWYCVPMGAQGIFESMRKPLWIELKTEKGKVSEDQAKWALYNARAGAEVVVLRPRHFFGTPDMVHARLVMHYRCDHLADQPGSMAGAPGRCIGWCQVLVRPDMTAADVMAL